MTQRGGLSPALGKKFSAPPPHPPASHPEGGLRRGRWFRQLLIRMPPRLLQAPAGRPAAPWASWLLHRPVAMAVTPRDSQDWPELKKKVLFL